MRASVLFRRGYAFSMLLGRHDEDASWTCGGLWPAPGGRGTGSSRPAPSIRCPGSTSTSATSIVRAARWRVRTRSSCGKGNSSRRSRPSTAWAGSSTAGATCRGAAPVRRRGAVIPLARARPRPARAGPVPGAARRRSARRRRARSSAQPLSGDRIEPAMRAELRAVARGRRARARRRAGRSAAAANSARTRFRRQGRAVVGGERRARGLWALGDWRANGAADWRPRRSGLAAELEAARSEEAPARVAVGGPRRGRTAGLAERVAAVAGRGPVPSAPLGTGAGDGVVGPRARPGRAWRSAWDVERLPPRARRPRRVPQHLGQQ